MDAVALDTLKLARALREQAQLSIEHAEGFASAIAEALQGDLATKGDLNALRAELRADQQEIRSDLRELELTLGAGSRQLEQKLHGEMQQLEQKLQGGLERLDHQLQGQMQQLEQSLRGQMQQLEHKLKNAIEVSKNETSKWIIGMIGLQTVAVLGAPVALMRFVRV